MLIKEKLNRSDVTGIQQSPLDRYIDNEIAQGRGHFINVNKLIDKRGKRLPAAVCLVIKCIIVHRIQAARQATLLIPVTKAIHHIYLAHYLFNEFEYWHRSACPEDESEAQIGLLSCLGVEIKRASKIQMDSMTWDFYPVETAKA